jgi:glycosyltransferase involved in cell wall biosynthesis
MFSVIIPLYNKEKYVAKTLESVFSQTYQNFEIVIVDDGSTDNSLQEVEKFTDLRIRIIQQKNAGVSAARNRGIAEARSDLIAFLDADDEWLPSYLNEIHNLVQKFPECSVFATNYKIVDSHNKERFPVDTSLLKFDEESGIISNYFDIASRTAPPIWTSAVVIRKSALNYVGGFPVGITLGEDLVVWARLACKYKIAYSKSVMAIYNFQSLAELTAPGKKPDEVNYVGTELAKLIDHCSLESAALKRYIGLWHRMRLNEFMKRGERIESFKEMKKIISYNKRDYKSYVLLSLAMLPNFIRKIVLKSRAIVQEKQGKQ